MPGTTSSFVYDPYRQGYDTNSWKTILGAPAVVSGGRLAIDTGVGQGGAAVHYADFLKGDIIFNVNTVAPGADVGHYFGVGSPDGSAYIRFHIGADLLCETGDGATVTSSAPLTWTSSWGSANTEFRIKWEPGGAKFFINDTQVYAVSDASVPYGPLSLYLADDSTTPMTIGRMTVNAVSSFVMTPKTSDTSSFGDAFTVSSAVAVTESVTMKIVTLVPSVSDSITVSESVTVFITSLKPSVNDTVTVTENFAKA